MMNLLKRIIDYTYLRNKGVLIRGRVLLENRRNIIIGSKVMIGDRARIRSRCDSAKIFIGNSTRIREYVEINAKAGVININDNCFIAKFSWIGGFGEISIGPNSMVGIGSVIVSSDHDYINIKTPYYDNSEIPKPISIGSNVWIGSGCIVLGGSEIGSGSVVAAGSVVQGIFPPNSLIVGIPGKVKSTIKR